MLVTLSLLHLYNTFANLFNFECLQFLQFVVWVTFLSVSFHFYEKEPTSGEHVGLPSEVGQYLLPYQPPVILNRAHFGSIHFRFSFFKFPLKSVLTLQNLRILLEKNGVMNEVDLCSKIV